MNYSIEIALVGALINIMLSVIIPCIIKKSDNSMMNDMKQVYKTNRELIFSSSIIIGITIYLALEFTPQLKEVFDSLVDSDSDDMRDIINAPILITSNFGPRLSNLSRL